MKLQNLAFKTFVLWPAKSWYCHLISYRGDLILHYGPEMLIKKGLDLGRSRQWKQYHNRTILCSFLGVAGRTEGAGNEETYTSGHCCRHFEWHTVMWACLGGTVMTCSAPMPLPMSCNPHWLVFPLHFKTWTLGFILLWIRRKYKTSSSIPHQLKLK